MIKNKQINRVFDDLDAYRAFCVEYGFRFAEADLYKRNGPYGQYERLRRGDYVRNNWQADYEGFEAQAADAQRRHH
jgi:hypothetical protein